jgi:hypothetical protein
MARSIFTVSRAERGWQVTGDGSRSESFSRKEDAVRWGRQHARRSMPSQLVVKGANGRIQTEYTYGNDPREAKG